MSSVKTILGRWGEAQVGEWLHKHGYHLIASGYRCRMGEVDLIAAKGNYLAFVEVKLRKDDHFAYAREQVTLQKQRRIRSTAEYFLAANPDYADFFCRFDVAEVYAPDGARTVKPKICYYENAFE